MPELAEVEFYRKQWDAGRKQKIPHPPEQAVHVYARLISAGQSLGLRHAGLKALASLRMEKGYRDYGHDIDNTDSVLEAGLGFAVGLKKPGGFIGKAAG